jgi:antitoxin (DNA-binding transcriptional repressor) of toxin-antitoxin stability system
MITTVGIQELKDHLDEYLRRVRSGETTLVVDGPEVVAQLNPPLQINVDSSFPPGLVDLARRGLATLGGPNNPAAYGRLKALLTWDEVAKLLDEERGSR